MSSKILNLKVENLAKKFLGVSSTFIPILQARNRTGITNRHWNPKWKRLRGEKVVRVEIPKLNQDVKKMSPEKKRSMMRKRGLEPAR